MVAEAAEGCACESLLSVAQEGLNDIDYKDQLLLSVVTAVT